MKISTFTDRQRTSYIDRRASQFRFDARIVMSYDVMCVFFVDTGNNDFIFSSALIPTG